MKHYILVFSSENDDNAIEIANELDGAEFRTLSAAYADISLSYDTYEISDFVTAVNNGECENLCTSYIAHIIITDE